MDDFFSLRRALAAAFFLVAVSAAGLDRTKSITQYGLDSWDSRSGLPQNSVSSLLQTSDGYIWFGTEEGLVRFDGVRFTVYSSRNTAAFRQNTVETLAEGRDGSLWIGTESGLLRKRGDSFVAYRNGALPDDSILSLLSTPDGSIWIGTQRGGLFHWRNERFGQTRRVADGLPSDTVKALARSRDGRIWIGTEGGLACLDQERIVRVATSPADGSVGAISEGRDGAIWFGTAKGAVARVVASGVTLVLPGDSGASTVVTAIHEDRDGSIWVATDGGLLRMRDGNVERLTSAEGLVRARVLALLEDREGSLWVGTDGGGLARLRDAPIVSYTKREGLTNDFVRGVLEDTEGSVWIGTRGGGLNRFHDGSFSALTTNDGLPDDSISALAQGRDGSLWIGTAGGGVARRKDGRVRLYERREGISPGQIRVLFEDRRGAVWIGTNATGVNRIDGDQITAFPPGLSGDSVQAICEDREGALWIGTTTGLTRWKDGAATTYRVRDGLSSESIRSLKADPDGTLWIGTSGGGLIRRRGDRFAAVTARHGLYDDVVFAILEDDRQNLWMSCNRGIFRVARRDLEEFFAGSRPAVTSIAYGEADGMKSAECNGGFQPAAWKGADGRLWFATIRGVSVIDPAAIRINPDPPPVVIERVVVDGREIPNDPGRALLPGTRSLEIQYTGLSFLGAERMRFRYRLQGFDAGWINADTRRAAFYTNLAPGHYTFYVTASNRDGVWNQKGAVLPFSIEPLFTQTRLFAGLVLAAVCAVLFAGYQLRVRSLRSRARQLEGAVSEAVSKVRVLRGLFPICASCKKIRDDKGYWSQIEGYIREHSEAEFSHSICPECMVRLYPEFADPLPGVPPKIASEATPIKRA